MAIKKVESTCTSCGKTQVVDERIAYYDHNGVYHICKRCFRASKLKEGKKNGK